MKPYVLETSLTLEHQTKALLVKLTWVMFSGICLVFISSMRWDDGIRAAYFFGKLGVGLALLAGVGLLAAGVVCLDDSPNTLRVRKALWGFAVFWLALVIVSWFLTKNNMMMIDVCIVALACIYLAVARRKTVRTLALAAGVMWALSGASLLLASIIWWGSSAKSSFTTTILLALLCLLTGYFCFAATNHITTNTRRKRKTRKALNTQGEYEVSEDSHEPSLQSFLDYVRGHVDFMASMAVVSCAGVLLEVILQKNPLAAPTVVTALIGLASALTAKKIRIHPVFHDRLRISSSPMGTQFIYPVQILLEHDLFTELEAMISSEPNNPSQPRQLGHE